MDIRKTRLMNVTMAALFGCSATLSWSPFSGLAADHDKAPSKTPVARAQHASPQDKAEAKADDTTSSSMNAVSKESESLETTAKSDETAQTTEETAKPDETADAKEAKDGSVDPVQQALSGGTLSQTATNALQHYDLARRYFSKWQLPLAETELEVTIMYAPSMKIAHRDYSLVSLFRGHPVRAFAEALMTVGVCESVPLDQTEKAALIQKSSKVHYTKALECARAKDWDNAINELQWALTYTPDKPAIMRSLAFCYASKGNFTMAEQQYNQCFKVDPEDAFSHADFSYLLAEHGHPDKAQGQLTEALKLAPQAAALHVDMGWIAQTKGDFGTAQSELEEAIKLCPKQPGLWLQLGKVLERAGKPNEAKHAYSEVLAIDSTEDEAKERLQSLNTAPADQTKPKVDGTGGKGQS